MSNTDNPGSVSDSTDPMVGQSIAEGRYRITGTIGEGGMGKVYKGEQRLGDRTRAVAIKTLQPDLAQDPQIVQRFLREAGTVAALEHPNTIKFYESGQLPDGKLFVAMEFIQGESLAHVIARAPIAPQRCEYILGQICGSLAEAHEQGIVHRDLKPENIILTQKGAKGDFVKVLDFGIAKRDEAQGEAEAKLTRQGMVLGTPPYMSPEQFTGQPLRPTSDVYSLAIVVYEMLTGKLPYQAATPWEWATKHLTGSPTPFEAHATAGQIPQRQKAAVMRALSRDARQRPQNVTEFLNEFTGGQGNAGDWAMASGTSQQGQNPGVPPTAMNPGYASNQGYMSNPGVPGSMVPNQPMNPGMGSHQGGIPGTMAVPMTGAPGAYPSNPMMSNQGYTPAPSNAGFNPVQPPSSNPGFNPVQPGGFNPAYGSGQGQPYGGYPSNQGQLAKPNTGSPMKVLGIAAAVVVVGAVGIAVAMGGKNKTDENNGHTTTNQAAINNTQPVPQMPVPQMPVPQQPVPQMPVPQQPVPQLQPIPPQPVAQNPAGTDPNGTTMQPMDPSQVPTQAPQPVIRRPSRPSCPGSASAIDDLILSGRCRQAQAMFRAMRSSGCAGRAADSFGSACAAP
ncbi:MAG: protein kinase [Myxococcales bacterium]|nr:protein kinase [Myxococcales bacterium]